MKVILATYSALLALLAFSRPAGADTLYVSPTGTADTGCTTRANPCSLSGATATAVAGDTVVLMDGVYRERLYVQNSGTASAWITFRADECATPIIEGEGVGPNVDNQDNGVHSTTAQYVRFVGIVSRGWNTGFGNGWAGGVDSNAVSNGHWEIEYCIGYSNGRTGFTFFSAEGFRLKNSISAHNGSSTVQSWSSGVTLFEASGTNVVEGNISFENTDAQRRTDGSGFIADEMSNGVTFVNNLAFGNSGSCLRLTDSSGTRFINNTCYRNSQFGSAATGPTNPSELYFTNAGVTVQNVTFMNNVIVGTGQAPAGSQPVVNMPTSGWSNNVVTTGSPTFFTAPTGTNPSFVPAAGDTMLTGRGASGSGVPTSDVGFDPKCLVKRTPIMVGQVARVSTWQYDVDIDYIKSIGGVAKCFNPKMRTGTPDIGAYRPGTVTTVMAGSCVPAGAGGMGGAGGTGAGGRGGTGGTAAGGRGGTGGAAGVAGTGMGGAMDGGTDGGRGGVAGTGAIGADGGGGTGGAAGVAGTGMGGAMGAGAAGVGGAGASPDGGQGGIAGTGQAGGGGMAAGIGGVAGGGGGAIGSGGGAVAGGGSGGGALPAGSGGTAVAAGAGGSTGGTTSGPGGGAAGQTAGCGCQVSRPLDRAGSLAVLWLLPIGVAAIRRGRRARRGS